MSNANLSILIPALKKTVAFQDDLVKKLAGISLIQRAINKAIELGVGKSKIHLLTDSEEIRLIAERNGVQTYWDANLTWSETDFNNKISVYLQQATQNSEYALLLSPYAVLFSVELINRAKQVLVGSDKDLLKPVKKMKRHLYERNSQSTYQAFFGSDHEVLTVESKAFVLFRSDFLRKNVCQSSSVLAWSVDCDLMEIESYQDWWVCEKLLRRRRIVFRIIGNDSVGMGHIYRALSLAHEISSHEVFFVSDVENLVAVNKLAGYDYWLGVYEKDRVVESIIDLKPDLVINDILSTTEADVLPFKQKGIKVVNFEDLGDGAKMADLTINELYDKPIFKAKNTLWGHQYFFLRDEFDDAKPHCFSASVDSILLAFGGTDQNDLSRKIYLAIKEICYERNIHINIITGSGYKGFYRLRKELVADKNVTLTNETGVISRFMEVSQIAIISNGRTVYELAHMNILGVVISQHKREVGHEFSCEENGFVNCGVFEERSTEQKVQRGLLRLLDDKDYRKTMYDRVKVFNFDRNKRVVLGKMLAFLNPEQESEES